MNYLRITKYLYLIIGFVMLYAAFMKWNAKEDYMLEIILAGTAFFMYFFRNRFDKKFADRKTRGGAEQSEANQNKQNNQTNP